MEVRSLWWEALIFFGETKRREGWGMVLVGFGGFWDLVCFRGSLQK